MNTIMFLLIRYFGLFVVKMKSPTKRSRRDDTAFTKAQEVWIVLNAKETPPTQL
jgi:hypothetical protein